MIFPRESLFTKLAALKLLAVAVVDVLLQRAFAGVPLAAEAALKVSVRRVDSPEAKRYKKLDSLY
jgi:hypothetical protein